MKLQDYLRETISTLGEYALVRDMMTKEVIGFSFTVFPEQAFTAIAFIDNEQKQYIKQKMKEVDKDLKDAIKKLKKDLHSRQAAIALSLKGEKPNCLATIQFLIRDTKLVVIVNSRSLDVQNKLYQDIEFVRRLAYRVCKQFNIKLKYIRFFVGSMHYYV